MRGIIRSVGLAIDDQAEDAIFATEPLEGEDLLVDPLRPGRARRADDDLAGGLPQGIIEERAEISGAGELLTVPEDWREALRHRPTRGDRADELLRRPVG